MSDAISPQSVQSAKIALQGCTSAGHSMLADLLMQPAEPLFRFRRCGDDISFGDSHSGYQNSPVDDRLTFDVSNNHCLINQGVNGALQQCAFYEASHAVDHAWPGLWVQAERKRSSACQYRFTLEGVEMQPGSSAVPVETSYIDGSIPVTNFRHGQTQISIFSFAPMSADGSQALRLGVYGAWVVNKASEPIRFVASFPRTELVTTWFLDGASVGHSTHAIDLDPGQGVELITCVQPHGDEEALAALRGQSTAAWLEQTIEYYRRLTGQLEMPEDPFTAALMKRSLIQCANCITLDPDGEISVVNFGAFPAGKGVNIKDSIYPFYPLAATNPGLVQKGIRYLLRHGVRPKGSVSHTLGWEYEGKTSATYAGGISHSLGNTVGGIMLAGLYYRATADHSYFQSQPWIKQRINELLLAVIPTREDPDIWLFPSIFISDGYSLGDYHTGSNICAWFAFTWAARIIGEVYADPELSAYYQGIAAQIHAAILERCVIEGPFGVMFNEGMTKEGIAPFLYHDGEETDTTLSGFYDFLSMDDPRLQRFIRFAFTEHNPGFHQQSKGIIWQRYGDDAPIQPFGVINSYATFPSYITRLAGCSDEESMVGSDGAMTLIRSLTDANGALWWWPYSERADDSVLQRQPGQCGWATAVLVALLQSDFFGIKYCAPERLLTFQPFSPSSSYRWKGIRFGASVFDASFARSADGFAARLSNPNNHSIRVVARFPVIGERMPEVSVAGHHIHTDFCQDSYFHEPMVSCVVDLPPGAMLQATASG